MSKAKLTVADAEGNKYSWRFWRETGMTWVCTGRKPRRLDAWMLEDHEGCVRTLESTWADSVPCIRMILENYGLTANIS